MQGTQLQFNLKEGRENRDRGIETAVAHAESETPGWKEKTYGLFKDFLKEQTEPFMIENFRSWLALKDDYEFPPVNMAFGFIPLKAAREGLIKKIGYGITTNPNTNATPAGLWQKL